MCCHVFVNLLVCKNTEEGMIVNLTPLQRIQELSLECHQTDLEGISGVGRLLLPLTLNI